MYVARLPGRQLRGSVRLAEADERLVDELTASALAFVIVRPTGYFSDMKAFLDMARWRRIYLLGDGGGPNQSDLGTRRRPRLRLGVTGGPEDVKIGGPDVLSYEEIARLAATVVGRPARITHIPGTAVRSATAPIRHLTPARVPGPVEFLAAVMTNEMVAPHTASDHLADFYRDQVCRGTNSSDA